jgi:hypothetical protein
MNNEASKEPMVYEEEDIEDIGGNDACKVF